MVVCSTKSEHTFILIELGPKLKINQNGEMQTRNAKVAALNFQVQST